MRDHRGQSLHAHRRNGLDVAQEVDLAVGHEAPVFHGSHGEIRDANHVHLRQRVVHVEELLVPLQAAHAHVKSELELVSFARSRQNAHQGAAFCRRLHVLEMTNAERNQVRGHLGRRHEVNILQKLVARGLAGKTERALALGHVGQNHKVSGRRDRQFKLRLGRRLVHARKHATRVDRLHLRRTHVLLLPVQVQVAGPVETGHLVVQGAAETHAQAP